MSDKVIKLGGAATERINIVTSAAMKKTLKQMSEEMGRSMTDILLDPVRQYAEGKRSA